MGFAAGGSGTMGNASGSNTTSNTYSAGQSNLQDQFTSFLSKLIPSMSSGTLSPDVQAQSTGAADQINSTYSAVGDRLNRFLAARGFGKSGQTGQSQLQTELGRAGALAANSSAAATDQLQLNSSYLSDALQAAYKNIGSTDYGSGQTSGVGTSFGVSAKIPGLG